jgi:Protein of unknown function (DUF4230)
LRSLLCRYLAGLGLVLALFVPGPARAGEPLHRAIPYVKLLEKYGAYEPLLDFILEPVLAAVKTETVMKFALGVPQASARLEVYKFSGSIQAEAGDSCWLGNNRVKMRVPVAFRYEIDLAQLKAKDVSYDTARNILELKLPPVTLAKVVPDYGELEVLEKANPTMRSRASWYELKEAVLAEQVRPHAEALGQEKLSEANLVGRGVVQELFSKLYAPVREFKGMVIVVK